MNNPDRTQNDKYIHSLVGKKEQLFIFYTEKRLNADKPISYDRNTGNKVPVC